ncbi:hypothetical protein M5689_001504 [Euphorbia peplus]|nr:hypothetical protein M5689_001504 [Euphorbia peplus]
MESFRSSRTGSEVVYRLFSKISSICNRCWIQMQAAGLEFRQTLSKLYCAISFDHLCCVSLFQQQGRTDGKAWNSYLNHRWRLRMLVFPDNAF